MLSASVNAGKRLLVEENLEVVLDGNLAHHRHQQKVVINRNIGLLELRRALELVRSHLVVTCLDRYAKPVGGVFEVLHKLLDPLRNRTPIVILKLLVLGGRMPHQRTTGLHQVRTGIIEGLVHEEIFLLPTEGRINLCNVLVKKYETNILGIQRVPSIMNAGDEGSHAL